LPPYPEAAVKQPQFSPEMWQRKNSIVRLCAFTKHVANPAHEILPRTRASPTRADSRASPCAPRAIHAAHHHRSARSDQRRRENGYVVVPVMDAIERSDPAGRFPELLRPVTARRSMTKIFLNDRKRSMIGIGIHYPRPSGANFEQDICHAQALVASAQGGSCGGSYLWNRCGARRRSTAIEAAVRLCI